MKQVFYSFMVIMLCIVISGCSKKDTMLPTLTKTNLVGSWAGTYTLTTPPVTSSGYTFSTTTNGNVLIEVKGDNQTSSIQFGSNPILYIGAIDIKGYNLTGKYYNIDSIPNIILENVIINTKDSTLNGALKNNIDGSIGEFSVKKLEPGVNFVLR